MAYLIGQTVRLTFSTFSDPAGTVPADPTAVTATISAPDGTQSTKTWANGDIIRDSVGVFHLDIAPSLAGHFDVYFAATGAVTTADEQSFDVRASLQSPVSVDDVKRRLNKSLVTTVDDHEIEDMLAAALALYERLFGKIGQTVTETRDGGTPIIMLDRAPVGSITSVTEYVGTVAYALTSQPPGATLNFYGYSLDDAASGKLVRRSSAGMPMPFLGGYQSVVITYTTATLPADHREVIVADVAGYFEVTQRGGGSVQAKFPGADEYESAYTGTPAELFPRIRNLQKQYQGIA